MTPQAMQLSTPTDTTIVITRTFNAPIRLVWAAMFTAEKIRRWMLFPPGWTITTYVCEPRVGGVLSVAAKTDEADPVMTLKGVFTEVVPHVRAVHTETMATGTGEVVGQLVEMHEFTEKGGITTMRITQTYGSKEARDGAVASGMDEGMEAGYKQLDAMLAQPAQGMVE